MAGYFDVRPKDDPTFLYGRKKELSEFISQIHENNWIAVLGPRRIGKTSLILCGLRNLGREYAYGIIDFRAFAGRKNIQPPELIQVLMDGLNRIADEKNKFSCVIKGLSALEEFELEAGLVRLKFKKKPMAKGYPNLPLILDKLNSECKKRKFRLVLGFDEAQELKKVVGVDFISILAHIFDYCKNIEIVFTGSQFGLFKEILEPDHKSSLYGRYIHRIKLNPFEKPSSMQFLEFGFVEKHVRIDKSHLEAIVNTINGIPGWLTHFGTNATLKHEKSLLSKDDVKKALKETLTHGKKVVINELNSFLKNRRAKKRYMEILKILAVKEPSWSKIKKALQIELGLIDDKNFSELLKTLVENEFVRKENDIYKIVDPILKKALGG